MPTDLELIANTRSGKVRGLERNGVVMFRGIPYASPPVGDRRWLPPVPEVAWDDVRDATEFSPQSAQSPFGMETMFGAKEPERSEDSLYLNVFTPACDDARRPVMVWIHGGAYVNGTGSTPWYDGTSFANDGVVMVSINYRLAAFGFLHLADLFGAEFEGAGNAGILDQVAALEWVRDCIDAFGGDPGNVTIFGESAGGSHVGTLLGLPRARRLYQGAIAQSGAASWFTSREAATERARSVCAKLGVGPGDVAALRAKTTEEIIAAMPAAGGRGIATGESADFPYCPVVDGTVLARPPLEEIAAGNAAGIRMMTGTNAHEITLFQILDRNLAALDEETLLQRAALVLADNAPAVVRGYQARRPGATVPELWTEIATDAVFRIPAIRMAEAQLAHGPVWMYLFTWETPAFGGGLRSTHAIEIPFVFDTLRKAEAFTGTGEDRQEIPRRMHAAWVAFAHGSPAVPLLPEWPAYDVKTRATMRIDADCELLDDPDGDLRALWPE